MRPRIGNYEPGSSGSAGDHYRVEAPEGRCHWPDCPHGANCVHARPTTRTDRTEQQA